MAKNRGSSSKAENEDGSLAAGKKETMLLWVFLETCFSFLFAKVPFSPKPINPQA